MWCRRCSGPGKGGLYIKRREREECCSQNRSEFICLFCGWTKAQPRRMQKLKKDRRREVALGRTRPLGACSARALGKSRGVATTGTLASTPRPRGSQLRGPIAGVHWAAQTRHRTACRSTIIPPATTPCKSRRENMLEAIPHPVSTSGADASEAHAGAWRGKSSRRPPSCRSFIPLLVHPLKSSRVCHRNIPHN